MDARILAALKYIEQDLSEQIELEEVSRKIGLSKFYSERLFHAEVGESFYAYLKRVRLHHAARRLKRTNQSVYEIAVAYGYTSNATFSRAFQRFFGVSPTRYRKELWGREDSFDDPPKIEIREIKPYYCIFARYCGPYERIRDWWCDFIGRLPASLHNNESGGVRFMGRIYDDPRVTPANELRYDCCYVFTDLQDSRIESDDLRYRLILTDPGLYAAVDNSVRPRPRSAVYSYILDRWLPRTIYQYSDLPGLEFFTGCPIDANSTEAPVCTMLVPLE